MLVCRVCVRSLFSVGVSCVRRGTVNELHDGECSPCTFRDAKIDVAEQAITMQMPQSVYDIKRYQHQYNNMALRNNNDKLQLIYMQLLLFWAHVKVLY